MLGVVGASGLVGYVNPPLHVDESFLDIVYAEAQPPPERRFRFANTCVEERCAQWTEGRCGAIDIALSAVPPSEQGSGLPACGIRASCRWFGQSGRAACEVCPLVITDIQGDSAPLTT